MNKQKNMLIFSATGSGRKRTIPACQESKVVRVIAAHGRNKVKINALVKSFPHIKPYTDLKKMLTENEADIAYIASPPFLHENEVIEALNSGLPVICEKPLAHSIEECAQIADKVRTSGKPFMVAHHLRHQKAINDISEILEQKVLGDVRSASFQWNFKINPDAENAKWKLSPKLGGGHAFFDAGVHAIDLSILFWGAPLKIFASGNKTLCGDSIDSVTCVLIYRNFTVTLNASQNQTTIGNDLSIFCEKGVIHAPQCFTEQAITELFLRSENGEQLTKYKPENMYINEVEAFCHYLDDPDSRFWGTTIDDAVMAVKILERISKSLETGNAVYFD